MPLRIDPASTSPYFFCFGLSAKGRAWAGPAGGRSPLPVR